VNTGACLAGREASITQNVNESNVFLINKTITNLLKVECFLNKQSKGNLLTKLYKVECISENCICIFIILSSTKKTRMTVHLSTSENLLIKLFFELFCLITRSHLPTSSLPYTRRKLRAMLLNSAKMKNV
jgi:hypothetical protein